MAYELECPFCNPQKDEAQHILLENETCYFLQHDREQDVLEGSGVIVPKMHRSNTFELTLGEWTDTYELLHRAKAMLDEKFAPNGYTLGWNVGEASNQSILHSHFHVIPRYADEPHTGKGIRHWLKKPDNKRERTRS